MFTNDCERRCGMAAAAVGLAVWLMLSGIGNMRWFEGLFAALMFGALCGAILIWLGCHGVQDQPSDDDYAMPPAARPAMPGAAAAAAGGEPAPPPASPDAAGPSGTAKVRVYPR